jgi:CRISPR-associated protein Csh2
MVKRISDIPDSEIRDISQLKVDLTDLVDTLKKHTKQIKNIEYKIDDRFVAVYNKNVITVDKYLKDTGFTLIPISI